MPLRSLLLAPAALSLAACASGTSTPGGGAPAPTTAQVNVAGSGTATALGSVVNVNEGQRNTVQAAPDAAYAALIAAYETVGIPLSYKDDARRRAGNIGYKARRQAGKVPMRFAVDCGEDLSGPKADSYEITMSVESSVGAGETPGTSTLLTVVNASGKPVSFSGAEVTCTTKGEIERRLQKAVAETLGGK